MKELRCIVFTESEVINAIIDRRRRLHEPLPEGTVRGLTFKNDGNVETTVKVEDDYGTDRSITLREPEVAAALISWCMNRRIPMPADSDKHLQVIKNGLTLMITMNFNKPAKLVTDDGETPAVKRAKARPR
ncbi:conserved hypothetical protein [uncultured Gammaproteobacteria bacterium]